MEYLYESETQQEYKKNRQEELEKYEIVKYPYFFETTIEFNDYINKYLYLKNDETNKECIESLVGRVVEIRKSSKKLCFYQVQANGIKLQLIASKNFYDEEIDEKGIFIYDIDTTIIKRGDVIGFYGYPHRSRSGELSVMVNKITLLAPCLKMLPKHTHKHFALSDQETRERKRYLDMIINTDNLQIFKTRHNVYKCIRNFLDLLGFIEVETPRLHPVVGGANAKPFITYHNDTKQNMYLRIAPELYLKQLIIGGMSKVYEIGPQFRNESADQSHNPEFTSLEFYMAYSDYNKLFGLCENLLSSVVNEITGSNIIKYKHNDKEYELDFAPSFARIDIMTELKKAGIEFDLSSGDIQETLDKICTDRSIPCENPRTVNRLLDKLIGHYVESKCIQPTFVTNHPKCMSPLAKSCKNNKVLSERFELFVLGMELCNAYSELNDPDEQYTMFMNQHKDKNNGDDESQCLDKTFMDALHYGLPCTAGFGCGIDRLIMLLCNKSTIRDVISFPILKNLD